MNRLVLLLVLTMVTVPLAGRSAVPRLFYSDIDSGPATGGEGGKDGAFVCVYGENFGEERGHSTIRIGGVPAAAYPLWTDTRSPYQAAYYAKACAQIDHRTPAGKLILQLISSAGTSNPLPFTVRPGRIFFVAPKGDDHKGDGSSEKPWQTIRQCKNKLAPGDICYAKDGSVLRQVENYKAGLVLNSSGKEGEPKAIVAYPGAAVSVDMSASPYGRGLESYLDGHSVEYWTIAGLSFNADSFAVEFNRGGHIRFVDNEVMCKGPHCNGPSAGFHTAGYPGNHGDDSGSVAYLSIYGNRIHDVGGPRPSKQYHNVYFSTNTNHVWFAWNSVNGNGKACRGIQFNSTGGQPQFDLHLHDNVIHDTVCDGINFASVDPSRGTVEAYNNVIYNAGTGPDPRDGASNYTCIYSPGGGDAKGPGGHGTIQIYNNTLFNCGNHPAPKYAGDCGAIIAARGWSPNLQLELTNNIIEQPPRVPYLGLSSSGNISGSHNDCYGAKGGCPKQFSESLNVDPGFVNLSGGDFRLSAGSPLRGKGKSAPVPASGHDENGRGAAPSIGAYE
jgi:hypothetical protein